MGVFSVYYFLSARLRVVRGSVVGWTGISADALAEGNAHGCGEE